MDSTDPNALVEAELSDGCWTRVRVLNHLGRGELLVEVERLEAHWRRFEQTQHDQRLSDWVGRYAPALICHVNKHIDSYHIKNPRDTIVYLPEVHDVRSGQAETFRAVAELHGISAKALIELNQTAYAPSDRCPSESAAWRNQLRGATADSVVPPDTQLLLPEYVPKRGPISKGDAIRVCLCENEDDDEDWREAQVVELVYEKSSSRCGGDGDGGSVDSAREDDCGGEGEVTSIRVVIDGDWSDEQQYRLDEEGIEWRWPPSHYERRVRHIDAAKVRPLPPPAPDDWHPRGCRDVQVYQRGTWRRHERDPAEDVPDAEDDASGEARDPLSWKLFGVINGPLDNYQPLQLGRSHLRPDWSYDGFAFTIAPARPLLLLPQNEGEEEDGADDERGGEEMDEDEEEALRARLHEGSVVRLRPQHKPLWRRCGPLVRILKLHKQTFDGEAATTVRPSKTKRNHLSWKLFGEPLANIDTSKLEEAEEGDGDDEDDEEQEAEPEMQQEEMEQDAQEMEEEQETEEEQEDTEEQEETETQEAAAATEDGARIHGAPRLCGTPGCTLNDGHSEPCTCGRFAAAAGPRRRKPSLAAVEATASEMDSAEAADTAAAPDTAGSSYFSAEEVEQSGDEAEPAAWDDEAGAAEVSEAEMDTEADAEAEAEAEAEAGVEAEAEGEQPQPSVQPPRPAYDAEEEELTIALHSEINKQWRSEAKALFARRLDPGQQQRRRKGEESTSLSDIFTALVERRLTHPGLLNYANGKNVSPDGTAQNLGELYLALATSREAVVVGAASVTLHRRSARGARGGDGDGGGALHWAAVVQLFAVDERYERNGIGGRLIRAIKAKTIELRAERLIVPSGKPLGPRNWWVAPRGGATVGFQENHAVTSLDQLMKDSPRQLMASLPTSPPIFLPFHVHEAASQQRATWLSWEPSGGSCTLLFLPLPLPGAPPLELKPIKPVYTSPPASPQPAEPAGPVGSSINDAPSASAASSSALAAAAAAPGKRRTSSSLGAAQKRPKAAATVAAAGPSTSSSSGAGAARRSSPGGGSRKVVRKLVFGEFFAGSCRLSRAMRKKGFDVFSVERNRSAVEANYIDEDRLVVVDVRVFSAASLPRMDCAHFSPTCTSTTRLRRADLCGHAPRSEANGWWGDEDDPPATDFNAYVKWICDVIDDQRSRPGNSHFVFTVEQPANGNYPKALFDRLKRPVRHQQGCGATELQISFCHFLSGFVEEACGHDELAFCTKPTLVFTNGAGFIHAWGNGRSLCGWSTPAMRERGFGQCYPCEFIGLHSKKGGGVAQAAKGAAGRASGFPYEFVIVFANLMSQCVAEHRREAETYARSDQTVTPSAELHSVEAFCRMAGNWERR